LLIPTAGVAPVPVGVLYLDAKPEDAFGKTDVAGVMAKELEKEPAVRALADAVAALMTGLSAGGAFLEFAAAQ
jgi:hypothetical protein